jgi:enoyl-CoA hydratase/carnithine racemase
VSQDDLIYSLDGNIITLTLNRPDRMNAISVELEEELHVAFDRADRDRSVRAIILTGTGNAFSAGYDMAPKGGRDADPSTRSMADYVEYWQRRDGQSVVHWSHMWGLGKPIIAAVNGWALGGGFWYALAADLTIASDRAVFGQPEVRHISRSTYLFGAVCGWKNANRWALTGDHFDAQEAHRIGMVNEVVPHDQLMEKARELARRIALVPEPSVRLNKAIMMQSMQAAGVQAGLRVDGALSALVHTSHNEDREKLFKTQREQGTKAYLEMRDGPFQPEPMGPRSAKAQAARAARKKD